MRRMLVFLFLLISTLMQAQTISFAEATRYADLLVARNILNKKGKETLLKEIKSKAIETEHPSTVKPISYTEEALSRETILQFCAQAFAGEQMHRLLKNRNIEKKIKQEDSLIERYRTFHAFDNMGGKYTGCISALRSTIGFTRTRTLDEFKQIGLIDERVYSEAKAALLDSTIRDEVELLAFMLNRSTYYTYYEFNKKEQEEYAESLVQKGLLTAQGKEALLASYKQYELKSIPEMLSFSERYIQVELQHLEPKPEVTYPIIFKHIQKLLPEFQYSDLQVDTTETDESDLIRSDATILFFIAGNTYRHTFFHNYRRKVPDPNIAEHPSWVDQDFHKGVNKWLTDSESPYRLYTVNIPDSEEGVYGNKRVGLLLLKAGEAELISRNAYLLSQESFDNRLSKRNLNHLIESFIREGFFTYLSAAELDSAKERIATADIGSIEQVLLCFPKTIVLFDWETGNLENPYEDLTRQFEAAARGSFTVTDIADEYKKGWKKEKRVKYGFTMNGRRYEAMLSFEEDWLDPKFMELLKGALKENKIDGDIYYCIDNGQESGYVFLTSKQYRFVKEQYPDLLKED